MTGAQVVQEWLIGINGVNQGTKFYRKRQCLTTRPTTGVDDRAKLVSRKKAQDMQGISVAARPELFNTTEA